MSAVCDDEKHWKLGVRFNRCLCVIWIITIFGLCESLQSSVIIIRDDSCDPCYRKILAGKRLSENHVRRNFRCDRIEDCHRNCDYESNFVCEGFNYGRLKQLLPIENDRIHGYMCQLTSVTGSRMDPRRDFVDDTSYDYYERDRSCPSVKPPNPRVSSSIDWSTRELSDRLPNDRTNWQTGSYSPNSWSTGQPTYEVAPLIPPKSPYTSRSYVPSRQRPDNYDYYSTIDHQPRKSYLPQRQSYNDIFPQFYNEIFRQSNNFPLPKNPSSANEYYPRYYYGNRESTNFNDLPKRRQDQQSISKTFPVEQRVRNYGYNYGPAYGYDSKKGSVHASFETGWIDLKSAPRRKSSSGDCSVRSLTGFKVSRSIIVASHTTGNLEECEMLCTARSDCQSFAYRYSLVATAPNDNCLLSNVKFERLDFYADLEPERDYDIYAISDDPRKCEGEVKKSIMGEIGQHDRSSEECFWRVKSGCGMPASLTREKIRVDNGIGECQLACVDSRRFTCRSFVFRYDSESDRQANCYLSDCPTSEIIAFSDDSTSLVDRHAELYERGSYGRGCEAYPFSTIRSIADIGQKKATNGQSCYSGYQGGCRLSPNAVSSVTRVDTETECRRQCSRMRQSQNSAPCMSFSFKRGDEKHGDNCYLSDVPRRDLRPGLDYDYDNDYVMYAWKELEPHCTFATSYDDSTNFDNYNYANQPNYDYRPQSLPAGFDDSSRFLGNQGFFAGNNFIPAVTSTTTNYQGNTGDYGFFSGPSYIDDFSSFNRHYTVNGYPCKRGTKCEINKIVGFWSCEPEGAEFGSWDYCCEPKHHCGFSRGYSYPWCYVGSSEDQWRPCSDKYYPYMPSPRPTIAKNFNTNYRHIPDFSINDDITSYRRHYDDNQRNNNNNNNNEETSLNKQARHWPIAFLHSSLPPNTTDSVALANENRETNNRLHEKYPNDKNNRSLNSTNETTSLNNNRRKSRTSHLTRRGLNEKYHHSGISTLSTDDKMEKNVLPSTTVSSRNYSVILRKNNNVREGKTDVRHGVEKKRGNLNYLGGKTSLGRVERVERAKVHGNNEFLKINESIRINFPENFTNYENMELTRTNLSLVER